jgi:FAD/FMN-containing dehydrogenase
MSLSRSPEEIAMMRSIKDALDPRGLLNPGVLL